MLVRVEARRGNVPRRPSILFKLPGKGKQKVWVCPMFTKSCRGMKMLALAAMASVGICATPMARAAALVNGGFELSPDFTGFSTIGNTTLQAADFHAPTEGLLQALISNGTGDATSGNNSVAAAQLETFLNLSAGTLTNPSTYHAFNGSAIKQTFSVNAGDVLSFNYDFLTNETIVRGGVNDAALLVSLQNGSGPAMLNVLGAPVGPFMNTNPLDGANGFAAKETGYKTFTTTIAAAGTYTLGLAVTNANDANFESGLLVDNITITPGNNNGGGGAVPLPLALLVMPMGAAVAGLAGKRLRATR